MLVTKDSRTRELAEYHHLNAIHESKLNEKLTLQELVESRIFRRLKNIRNRISAAVFPSELKEMILIRCRSLPKKWQM